MRTLCLTAIVMTCLLAISACDKDDKTTAASTSINCDSLKTGIKNLDKQKVNNVITGFISQLPDLSQKHTAENIQKLADAISGQCHATVKVLCYACIKTLPEMSEIKVSYIGGVYGTIDITMDRGGIMKFVNVHE